MPDPCLQVDTINEMNDKLDTLLHRSETATFVNGGGRTYTMNRLGKDGFEQMVYDSVKAQEGLQATVNGIMEILKRIEPYISDKLDDKKTVKKWENKITVAIVFIMLLLNFWFTVKEKIIYDSKIKTEVTK